MILQALTDYYRALSRAGQISPPGWGQVKVSYALHLSWDGELTQAVSIPVSYTHLTLPTN